MQLADLAGLALSESQESLSDSLWTSRHPVLLPPSPVPGQKATPDSNDSLPQLFPRNEFGFCASKDGDVYIHGGAIATGRKDVLFRYSTKENTITPLRCWGANTGDRQAHGLAIVGNVLALYGGWRNGPADPSLFLLNLVSREWSKIVTRGQSPGKRYHHTMTAIDTTIYVFGGWENTSWDGLWAFDLNTLRTEPTWELIKPSSQEQPSPGAECTLVPYQNQLILFGGWSGYRRDDVWSFDVNSKRWSELWCVGDIPPPRFGHKAAVLDDVMYVVGGFGEGDIRLNDIFALKISERRWFKLRNTSTTPMPRRRHASACIGTKLFIFGGQLDDGVSERDSIHVLDTKHTDILTLHTPERLMELDIESRVMLTSEELGNWVKKLGDELQMQQVKVGEMQSANLKLESRVTELDVKLRGESTKVQELSAKVGEILVQNSRLENRVKELEGDNDKLKRSQIVPFIVESSSTRDSLASLQGSDAQIMADYLAELLERQDMLGSNTDRRRILHLLSKLAKSAQIYPRCIELPGVQCDLTRPVNDEGGFGLIYKGIFQGQTVCVKAVRVLESGSKETETKVLRAQAGELALLVHVSHPNVIPLYGAYLSNELRPRICIVSPWLENGDLADYLKKFPDTPLIPLTYDLAAGLEFLHDIGIIHADLKARNVLVSQSRRAMLADFGVSTVLTTSVGTTTAKDFSGTMFWMAPEQLLTDNDGEMSPPNQQSDMWSFACVCFEVLTGRIPFASHYTPSQLLVAFMKGKATPLRPKPKGEPTIVNGGPLLELAEKCWNYDPSQRPSAAEVLKELTRLNVNDKRPSMEEELAMFKAAKDGRAEVTINYNRVLSIVQKK